MSIRTRIWVTFLPLTFFLMCLVAFLSLRHARQHYWNAADLSYELTQLQREVSTVEKQIAPLIHGDDLRNFQHLRQQLASSVRDAGEHARRSKQQALLFSEQFTIVSAASLFLLTILCFTMARFISAPILSLRERARRIANGDLAGGETLNSYGEVKDLSRDIDLMRERIKTHIENLDHLVSEKALELHQSEAQYHLLFSAMTAGSAVHEIVCDDNGTPVDYRFLEINPAFEKLTGLKHGVVIGALASDVLPGLDKFWIETYGQVALTGRPMSFEHYSPELHKHFLVRAYCPKHGQFAVIFSDTTQQKEAEGERRRLERQVQHAQKLESLGVLAGGIAHDFNNLLMGILGNADLALSQLAPGASGQQELHEIEKASHRAADLCKQMLAYSGKGRFVVEPVNLSSLVEDMTHMLQVSISKSVILKLTLADDISPVEADATQLRQIIMNLVINASEAIGDKSGTVSIVTGEVDCDRAYLQETYLDEDLPAGRYAFIEVSDSGCGMSRVVKERVFEPFFTTKFAGRGLGMAAVLGILRGHRGAIKMYSEEGSGTTFKVLLPSTDRPLPDSPTSIEVGSDWQGRGTVLLADDEEVVRNVAGLMLERAGFEVLTAADGKEAVEIFARKADDVVCVILDLTMPHMGGEEAFRQMRQINASTPVILSSGYNEQEVVHRFAGKGLAAFIQKPYRSSSLVETIKRVLSQSNKTLQTDESHASHDHVGRQQQLQPPTVSGDIDAREDVGE